MSKSNYKNYKKSTYNNHLKGGEKNENRITDDNEEVFEAKPLQVRVYNNFDKAIKAFRAMVQKERILSLYKEYQRYEKPSDKKRRKRNEMKRKLLEIEMKKNSTLKRKKKSSENKENSSYAEKLDK